MRLLAQSNQRCYNMHRMIRVILIAIFASCMNHSVIASNYSGFKSYMSYRAITNNCSKQWELQQGAITDVNGLRRYDNLIMIAIGTGWGFNIGDKISVELSSGEYILAVVGDYKADIDTDINNITTRSNGCQIEFIVDCTKICRIARRMGDMSYAGFEGIVVDITKYKAKDDYKMGLEELQYVIGNLIKNMPEIKTEVNRQLGSRMINEAIPRTPVVTGRSKMSWKKEVSAENVRVFNDATNPQNNYQYASNWNFNRNSSGYMAMQRSANIALDSIQDIVDNEILKALDR